MSETFIPAVIEMRGVNIGAAARPAANDVNWSVRPGEFWVVAGQQQSGKSNLLMHAAGLTPPAQGGCRVFGCATDSFDDAHLAERLRAGFVFAGGKLFNHLTVAENVALPLRYQKNLTAAAAAGEVGALLKLLELGPFADATPANLAVNWRQRAALARALVLKPELLLLDSPLAGLGVPHRRWLQAFLDRLWRGHEWLGGRPLTLAVTTDDLRPWRHPDRKFAVLDEQTFTVLGSWREVESAQIRTVKDLLAEPVETTL